VESFYASNLIFLLLNMLRRIKSRSRSRSRESEVRNYFMCLIFLYNRVKEWQVCVVKEA